MWRKKNIAEVDDKRYCLSFLFLSFRSLSPFFTSFSVIFSLSVPLFDSFFHSYFLYYLSLFHAFIFSLLSFFDSFIHIFFLLSSFFPYFSALRSSQLSLLHFSSFRHTHRRTPPPQKKVACCAL